MTSLLDWPLLTWSLGWTFFEPAVFEPILPPSSSTARLASTSLTFMFVEVAEPVWKMSRGNWPSSLPSITSCAACRTAWAISPGTEPSSSFTIAASPLIIATAAMNRLGSVNPEMGKLRRARSVWAP